MRSAGLLFGIGGLIEIVGGILIVIGLFTRPVLRALRHDGGRLFHVHAPAGIHPIINQGELAILFASCSCTFPRRARAPGASTRAAGLTFSSDLP